MTLSPPPVQHEKSLFGKLSKNNGGESFIEARFLPHLLPLILGTAFGLVAAFLILGGNWFFLVALVFIVPVVVLFLRYPFIAVLIWLLVFPFFVREVVPGSRYVYWLLHRAMIPGAFGIAILAELLGKEKKRMLRLGVGDVAVVVYLLLSIINILLLDQAPIEALIRYYDRIFVPFCMYGLVRLTAPTGEDLKRIAWIAPFAIITQSAIGLASWFNVRNLPAAWLNREGERTVGTFGNPGVFTTTLVFFSLFLFQYAIRSKSTRVRLACFALVGLSLVSIFFSFSRGSWLGALLVAIGVLYLYPRVVVRFGVVFLLISYLIASTFFRPYLTLARERLLAQDSAEGRIIGGAATLGVIRSSPLFGVGFGNHEEYDEQYRSRVFNLAVNESHTSHNTYLLLTAEMGLVGLFLYLLPAMWWLVASRKVGPTMPPEGFAGQKMMVMMWLVLLNHVIVGSFTDMIQSNLFSTSMWWLTLGIIATLATPYLAKATAKNLRTISKGKSADPGLVLR
jgi:O-antigen ligase